MQKSIEDLAARIRQDLNEYQAQVQARLDKLLTEGLVSQTQLKEIIIDAKITGQSVVEALTSQANYSEEVTEIYVYSLFDRYKSVVEKKIANIEQRGLKHETKTQKVNPIFNWQKSPILKLLKSLVNRLFNWQKSPILKLLKTLFNRFKKQAK